MEVCAYMVLVVHAQNVHLSINWVQHNNITMKLSSKQNYFELKYLENGLQFTEVICTGIIDETELVVKYIRKKYKEIQLVQISKLDM